VLIKVFSPGYFAREDTKTPMRFAVMSVAINIALSLALFPWLGHVGIALATTIASWINVAQLWWGLRAKGHFAWDVLLTRRLRAASIASAVMAAALLAVAWGLPWLFASGTSTLLRLGAVMMLSLGGMIVYGAILAAFGGLDWTTLKDSFKRKPGTKSVAPMGGGD
jgi:putative peptidoglycan lipid II flippase